MQQLWILLMDEEFRHAYISKTRICLCRLKALKGRFKRFKRD